MAALKQEYETESFKLRVETPCQQPKSKEIEVFEIKNREAGIVKQEESVKLYPQEPSQANQEGQFSLLNTPQKEVFPALQPPEEHFDNLFSMYKEE